MMTKRTYPATPLVGVGAVVLRDDAVLLVKRGHPPRQGQWAFPGGLVELGERVFDAARRELREETGVEAEPIRVVDVYEVIERDREGAIKYHYIIIEILMRYVQGTPHAADDADAARWVPLTQLDTLELSAGVKMIVDKARRFTHAH